MHVPWCGKLKGEVDLVFLSRHFLTARLGLLAFSGRPISRSNSRVRVLGGGLWVQPMAAADRNDDSASLGSGMSLESLSWCWLHKA